MLVSYKQWPASRPGPSGYYGIWQRNHNPLDAHYYQNLFSYLADGILHLYPPTRRTKYHWQCHITREGMQTFPFCSIFSHTWNMHQTNGFIQIMLMSPLTHLTASRSNIANSYSSVLAGCRINNISHLLQLIKSQSFNIFLWCVIFFVNINYFKNLPGDLKKRDVKLKKLNKQSLLLYCYNYNLTM